MGQKTNPTGLRLGIIQGWESNWYSEENEPAMLLEDHKLREYLATRLRNGGLSNVVIERTPKRILLTLNTSRPGVIIGKGGDHCRFEAEAAAQPASHVVFAAAFPGGKLTRGVHAAFAGIEA